jgi:hypothetical protein
MRLFWGTILVVTTLLAAAAAVAPQTAVAMSTRDQQVKQNVLLLRGYIDTQAAGNGFLYPTRAQVAKGGGLAATIWPLNPWTGTAMVPGTIPGSYTYTPAADRHSYTLVAHFSSGSFKTGGASPQWLAAERAKATSDLTAAQTQRDAAKADLTTVQAALATALGERDDARAGLASTQASLAAMQASLASTQASLAGAQAQRDAAVADLTTVQAALATALGERDAAVADLTTTQAALATALGERDDARGGLAAAQAQRDEAVADLTTTQTALTAAIGERDDARAGLASAQADLTSAQASLASAQAQLAGAKDVQAELGARIIRGYIQQWGMLNRASTPAAVQVNATGIGAGQGFWPVNPWSGAAMAIGAGKGDVSYSGSGASSFLLSAHLSGSDVNLNGAVAGDLETAMTNLRDKLVIANVQCLSAMIDRYGIDNNGSFPTTLNQASVGMYALDEWPQNPWTGQPMASSLSRGDFHYSWNYSGSYDLEGMLSGGTYVVDDQWAEQGIDIRSRLKDLCAEGYAQVIKDYADQWATSHGGVPPTAEQLDQAGDVGAAHSWWPPSPWTGLPMRIGTATGDYSYSSDGAGFEIVLHQQQVAARYPGDQGFSATYTPR